MSSAPESTPSAPFDLSGHWTLSRTLSDDTSPLLALQNISYLLRKAASLSGHSLAIEHSPSSSPPTLAITVIPPVGFKGETSVRILDGEWREEKSFMFGSVRTAWRGKEVRELDREGYLSEEEWLGGEVVEEVIEKLDGKSGWTNIGIWGVVEREGKRHLVKRSVVTAKDRRSASARMVYALS